MDMEKTVTLTLSKDEISKLLCILDKAYSDNVEDFKKICSLTNGLTNKGIEVRNKNKHEGDLIWSLLSKFMYL